MRLTLIPAFVLLVIACSAVPIQFPESAGTVGGGSTPDGASVAADIVRHTNDARARNGLPALGTSAKLMEAARLHAEQMAAAQRASHNISGARYPTMQDRISAVSYSYLEIAENVAWNQRSAQEVVAGWMTSRGHRANMLDPAFTEMGAAMARSSRGEPYWIQVFGRPR